MGETKKREEGKEGRGERGKSEKKKKTEKRTGLETKKMVRTWARSVVTASLDEQAFRTYSTHPT